MEAEVTISSCSFNVTNGLCKYCINTVCSLFKACDSVLVGPLYGLRCESIL